MNLNLSIINGYWPYVKALDAEGAKLMNDLRNDALKEIFKRLTVNN